MNTKHVDVSLNKIRTVFEKASSRIEAMKPGDKIPATVLAEELGEEIGLSGATLYPTLKFLFDDYPNIKVLKGAHGGILKLATGEVYVSKKEKDKAALAATNKPISAPAAPVPNVSIAPAPVVPVTNDSLSS